MSNTTTNHVFSAKTLSFYAVILQATYMTTGTWPSDALAVSDADWQKYVSIPPVGQTLGAEPTGEPTWVPIVATVLSIRQQAVILLNQSIVTVVCETVPAINGTYAANSTARGDITSIAVGIHGGLGLPSGGTTFNYLDTTNNPHAWNPLQFIEFAKGVTGYIYVLTQVASGNALVLPSGIINIADY
jgi:hypothetical protein